MKNMIAKRINEAIVIFFGAISIWCFGTVNGINITHHNAVNVGVAKYMLNSENGKTYLYWNTTNGWVKEK
jgi:hypothetical protein